MSKGKWPPCCIGALMNHCTCVPRDRRDTASLERRLAAAERAIKELQARLAPPPSPPTATERR